MWSVVNFSVDNTVEVVPSFWVNKHKSAWPKKNAKHFIKHRIVPNKHDFEYLSIRKKMCKDLDDYVQACGRAKKAEVTSNVSSEYETNDETRTRQKNKKKREVNLMTEKVKKPAWSPGSINSSSSYDKIDDDTNDEEFGKNPDKIIIDTPSLFKNKEFDIDLPSINTDVKRKLNFIDDKSLSPDDVPAVEIGKNNKSSSSSSKTNDTIYTSSSPFKVSNISDKTNSTLDILNKINRTTLNTWYEIKTLNERIERIEKNIKIFEPVENTLQGIDTFQDSIYNLPLQSAQDLSMFEDKLRDNEFKKKMVVELTRLVRNSISGTIRAMLRFLFTDNLLQEYSFKGQKKKKVFSVLTSCSLILESLKRIGKYKNYNAIDAETPMRIFIAGAKFRLKGLRVTTGDDNPNDL